MEPKRPGWSWAAHNRAVAPVNWGCVVWSAAPAVYIPQRRCRGWTQRGKKASRFVPGYLICQMLARVGDTTAAGGGVKKTIKTVHAGAIATIPCGPAQTTEEVGTGPQGFQSSLEDRASSFSSSCSLEPAPSPGSGGRHGVSVKY